MDPVEPPGDPGYTNDPYQNSFEPERQEEEDTTIQKGSRRNPTKKPEPVTPWRTLYHEQISQVIEPEVRPQTRINWVNSKMKLKS